MRSDRPMITDQRAVTAPAAPAADPPPWVVTKREVNRLLRWVDEARRYLPPVDDIPGRA